MISDPRGEDWQRAVEALSASETVVVACHVSPDGDALGSMVGLAKFLRRSGKKVFTGWGSPDVSVPAQYNFLPGLDELVPPETVPDSPELFVAVDCADADRLGWLREKFFNAGARINIDHHISNDRFGDINLIDAEVASSSELVYELIKKMGGKPNRDEATCLYTGIVTDTGRFQYSNTNSRTLRAAAELMESGVDHVEVGVRVYESTSFEYLHVLGIVLSRARLEDQVVWSWLDQDDLGSVDLDETEHFIDILRAVTESEVAVLLKQTPKKKEYKASLRSKESIDVSEIAKALGGGGHARAAGFEREGAPDEIIADIRAQIPRGSARD